MTPRPHVPRLVRALRLVLCGAAALLTLYLIAPPLPVEALPARKRGDVPGGALLPAATPRPVSAQASLPPVPQFERGPSGGVLVGYFFYQAGGGRGGYSLTGAFWNLAQRLGGVETVGYPASRIWQGADGFRYQVTQGALLQAGDGGQAALANTFQLLEAAGRDGWLSSLGIPLPIKDDGAASFEEAAWIRLGWLTQPEIAARYWSAGPAATELYGLPMSRPERFGPFVAQRFQRIAFQLWLESVPGMPAPGSVSTVLGGDLLKEAGLVPPEALPPEAASPPRIVAGAAAPTAMPTAALPAAAPRLSEPRAPVLPVAPTATPRPAPAVAAAPGDVIGQALDVIFNTGHDTLREVAGVLVQRRVAIEFGHLPDGTAGLWDPRLNRITINSQYRQSSVEGMAGVLIHEGTHAFDTYRGRDAGTPLDCYDLEARAFANQARLWEALYGPNGKRGATDPLELEMNAILGLVNERPFTFAVDLEDLYQHQCG